MFSISPPLKSNSLEYSKALILHFKFLILYLEEVILNLEALIRLEKWHFSYQ